MEVIVTENLVSQAFPAGEVDPQNPQSMQDGNVLDRLCVRRQGLGLQLGKKSCDGCIFYDQAQRYKGTWEAEAKVCAHQNLRGIMERRDVQPENALMVAFTADNIGFYDDDNNEGKIKTHPYGWEIATGYNAYFASTDEVEAIGGRAADCSIVKVEFLSREGTAGIGLVHLTRSNIQGDTALSYGPDKNQSYLQFALGQMQEHYGVDVDRIRLSQIAKIDKLDYRFTPQYDKETGELVKTAEQRMDELFAGWFDAGRLHNLTNPTWQRGDTIDIKDEWKADYQEMTEHVIRSSGVPLANIHVRNAVNPGDVTSGHASNAAANDPNRPLELRRPDARDLYMVVDDYKTLRKQKAVMQLLADLDTAISPADLWPKLVSRGDVAAQYAYEWESAYKEDLPDPEFISPEDYAARRGLILV